MLCLRLAASIALQQLGTRLVPLLLGLGALRLGPRRLLGRRGPLRLGLPARVEVGAAQGLPVQPVWFQAKRDMGWVSFAEIF